MAEKWCLRKETDVEGDFPKLPKPIELADVDAKSWNLNVCIFLCNLEVPTWDCRSLYIFQLPSLMLAVA